MNIWVIGRSYPQKINNMQGSFELEQAKMLAKHGHTVSYLACVFHPFKKVRKWGYCHWEEDKLGVFTYSQVYTIERMKLHLQPFKSWVWNKLLRRVEEQTGTPDVIHVHYPANITVAKDILCYRSRGTRVICTEHWSQVQRQVIDTYERKQLKMYADGADAFLCVGPPLRDAVKEMTNTHRQLYVVPNVINAVFQPCSCKEKADECKFIAVGALLPNKQFDHIVRAFAGGFRGVSDASLIIVGGGVEAGKLEKLVDELGIQDQVTLTGKLTREETAAQVANSDVLICFSRLETFGVPIIEGWACGLPVIATTAAPVRDGWDDRLGLQVSPDDDDALVQCMEYVYKHRKEYDTEYIAQYAAEHYSEETVYRMLMEYYGQSQVAGRTLV